MLLQKLATPQQQPEISQDRWELACLKLESSKNTNKQQMPTEAIATQMTISQNPAASIARLLVLGPYTQAALTNFPGPS